MNNRYIYKGKRKDNGKWVEGYYVCLSENCHRIYTGYAKKDCGDYYPEYCEVIPETIRIIGGEEMNTEWILKAVETIKSGIADKLTKDNITIYSVKNIIRIDIKE